MKVYVVSRYNWDWRDILPPVVFDDKEKAKSIIMSYLLMCSSIVGLMK